jgi:hypothetical protein
MSFFLCRLPLYIIMTRVPPPIDGLAKTRCYLPKRRLVWTKHLVQESEHVPEGKPLMRLVRGV